MKIFLICILVVFGGAAFQAGAQTAPVAPTLEQGWEAPPQQARLRAYWWWLNGNVTKASITRDLEEMKKHGFAGAVIFDANGSSQDGNDPAPHGATFFSPEWRELFKHCLAEAKRLGLEISLNIQSGWNLGGPSVTQDDAAKKYVWSESRFKGGTNLEITLPMPPVRENFYKDSIILAYPLIEYTNAPPPHQLKNWKVKALQESLQPFSSPDSAPLFQEDSSSPKDADLKSTNAIDITSKVDSHGRMKWKAPPGDWKILRFGYTIGDHAYVSTSSDGWGGYALDVYDAKAFQNYWDAVVEPLIQDATNFTGNTLKYLHTDSWEVELANWTPKLPQQFQSRRGYSMIPWMPVLSGRIVNSREESDRFLFDYRKTLGDLAIDCHYRIFKENARKRGLMIHPESGGPHAVPIDAQRCLGMDDAPMSEFWAWSWTHRIGDENRFFVKQPASAAHTYAHKLVFAEGFTDIGLHWQESLWWNLKPSFQKALCEGLNVLVWHAFVCSPEETGVPGQQYFAGTHLNPKVTWWEKSSAFFDYINRCQWMLQQGRFVADVAYYYGDHVPNFARLKKSDPAHILPGYDYDVITADALLTRTRVQDGQIILSDGMSYRVLVLPDMKSISSAALKKIGDLVNAGATVIGPRPEKGETMVDFKDGDKEIKRLAENLWVNGPGKTNTVKTGDPRKILAELFTPEDCEIKGPDATNLDYIHRADGNTDIYFVANNSSNAASATVTFRTGYKAPELWDPVTGEHHYADAFEYSEGRMTLPLKFEPCGSFFVVFRAEASEHLPVAASNYREAKVIEHVDGPWTVHFDTNWGGPASVVFTNLDSWTRHPDEGVRFYSGTAVYEKDFTFTVPREPGTRRFLDIGAVGELAEIKVNGKSCGTAWCPPWRVDVTDSLKQGSNKIEIEVVNFWPNRLIGDAMLPADKRRTRTNIRRIGATTRPMESGLFGPVAITQAAR